MYIYTYIYIHIYIYIYTITMKSSLNQPPGSRVHTSSVAMGCHPPPQEMQLERGVEAAAAELLPRQTAGINANKKSVFLVGFNGTIYIYTHIYNHRYICIYIYIHTIICIYIWVYNGCIMDLRGIRLGLMGFFSGFHGKFV